MKIAIIGGGAAGFFAAIAVKSNYKDYEVVIFEKSNTVLSKVKISGGGRCNLTNAIDSINEFASAYPRGEKFLKNAFRIFNNKHSIDWFQSHYVPLITQDDNCVFPASQNSQSIIDCFLRETKRLGVLIQTNIEIKEIKQIPNQFELYFKDHEIEAIVFDKVIVTTGGSPNGENLAWIEKMNHKIIPPVPSLFTFNMPSENITQLMGIVIENALVSFENSKLKANGPLLITHWGMSGPAILKLSSFGARILNDLKYDFNIQVNWINIVNNNIVFEKLTEISQSNQHKQLANFRAFMLPERLWLFLLEKCNLSSSKKWGEIGKKGINKLTNILTNDVYSVKGKTTFREEFVTCGGVSLENIDVNTMQSKNCKNLYFAGEILDIDGITGGFNLQAAWTTGFIAGKLG
ncbi:MAG TPA: aminoacetone oxidase family FAD-binding enzyme [Bacteroidales bacterium]|nr:MAG: flavoprotein [Bacteroidetes bacterium GWF2_33_38]HBF89269.1 aminoacetone oxidase family FAD-binding enzyme [Bacteroidales bacterium]